MVGVRADGLELADAVHLVEPGEREGGDRAVGRLDHAIEVGAISQASSGDERIEVAPGSATAWNAERCASTRDGQSRSSTVRSAVPVGHAGLVDLLQRSRVQPDPRRLRIVHEPMGLDARDRVRMVGADERAPPAAPSRGSRPAPRGGSDARRTRAPSRRSASPSRRACRRRARGAPRTPRAGCSPPTRRSGRTLQPVSGHSSCVSRESPRGREGARSAPTTGSEPRPGVRPQTCLTEPAKAVQQTSRPGSDPGHGSTSQPGGQTPDVSAADVAVAPGPLRRCV